MVHEGEGWAIFDAGPGAAQRAMENTIRRRLRHVLRPSVELHAKPDPQRTIRDITAMLARSDNFRNPLAIPSAQELVMRQELGEFDA